MTIQELIDALTAQAADLPDGLSTSVRVGPCVESGAQLSRAVEVGDFTCTDRNDAETVHERYAAVVGHLHQDSAPLCSDGNSSHVIVHSLNGVSLDS